MLTRYQHRKVTWIDLQSPTSEEVRGLLEEFKLPAEVAEELLLPTMKPRVEFYAGSLIYLILHFPAFRHTHGGDQNQEIDFVIGKYFLITTRYDTIDPLHKFSKVFEVGSILNRADMGEHAGHLFFFMVRKLYKSLEHELEYISDALHTAEEHIFLGRERETVIELSRISHELIDFKQAVRLHQEVLESFEIAARRFFGEDFGYQLRTIIGEYERIKGSIAINIDTVSELRATNNALLSTKQSEIIQVLTIMTFITAPLSLIAAIFGMNTTASPLGDNPYDFWIVLGTMTGVATFFFSYFIYKKWL